MNWRNAAFKKLVSVFIQTYSCRQGQMAMTSLQFATQLYLTSNGGVYVLLRSVMNSSCDALLSPLETG
jgi:hypothetical protein